ncbi:DEAD/DEAH box helicase family protein [Mesorhizobium sp. KR1-2]|uniref:DEAD/DEAH box helicase n=1 Tax=Mesorhizobium sp. KR1-2 TaxID=3156609 RepID=UPI0032B43470
MRKDSGRHVGAIAARLSLRAPQQRSLEILDRIMEILPPGKESDLAAALAAIRREFPQVSDFGRGFPSLCFALATGVGKTRLMGAFVAYLHLAHGIRNFLVLAPSLTIHDKLIADFTPGTPKYVLPGIQQFSIEPPVIVTGENFAYRVGGARTRHAITVNIFNVAKINSEMRDGRSLRIRSLREEIGESYFDHLAGLDDLVLIMDEAHRYRGSAGVRAIEALKPTLGLELTATPFVEAPRRPVPFANVVFDYPLGRALADGFVKEPAVVTRENFHPAGKSPGEIEEIKLHDAIRLHEGVRVELEVYARENRVGAVKPIVLVIARDTSHAAELMRLIRSPRFFDGRFTNKVIQVDSSVREDEAVERLLKVERADEPTEIVIHVNMLREGWDVNNLYTIVPLRAGNSNTLVWQAIGRGLRLPYGGRTGIAAIDRLNIVAHDRFQEIVEEARRPDSPARLEQLVLAESQLQQSTVTVVSRPRLVDWLGIEPEGSASNAPGGFHEEQASFGDDKRAIARLTYETIMGEATVGFGAPLPSLGHLMRPEIRDALISAVASGYRSAGREGPADELAAVVTDTTEFVLQETIEIPLILAVPKNEAKWGYRSFRLDLSRFSYEVPTENLWATHLRTGQVDRIGAAAAVIEERLDNCIVDALVAFDDVAYEEHAELLYDLAGQVSRHLLSRMSERDARKVLWLHRHEIARAVHAQMQEHLWQEAHADDDVVVTRGYTALRERTFSKAMDEPVLDFRLPPADKGNMARHLFGGFARCLYAEEKFHSDAERMLAVVLDREALKWFRPAKGQFQLRYRAEGQELDYQPDFVAETGTRTLMIEVKASDRMDDRIVLAKRNAAVHWCRHATGHALKHGGKPWGYLLIPHDAIAENVTIEALARCHMEGRVLRVV